MNNQDYNRNVLYRLVPTPEGGIHSYFGNNIYRELIVNDAIDILKNMPSPNDIYSIEVKSKKVFIPNKRESYNILFKKTILNIKKSTEISITQPRDLIIKILIPLLKDGVPYNIYRLDLKSFYESVDLNFIKSNIDSLQKLSPISKSFIKHILEACNSGIPRGLSISSILSDFIMTNFDKSIKNNKNVFFYSRFIDDIIIISDPNTDIKRILDPQIDKVPNIKLNYRKYKEISISKQNDEGELNYLGYKFLLKKEKKIVGVQVEISRDKINKIKTRIVKSIISYIKSCKSYKQEELLIDRLKFLSGSYMIYDIKKGRYITAGVRSNYKHITNTNSLRELDFFIKSIFYSKKGRLSKLIRSSINKNIRQRILSISFVEFYDKKIFFKFKLSRLSEIKECWK